MLKLNFIICINTIANTILFRHRNILSAVLSIWKKKKNSHAITRRHDVYTIYAYIINRFSSNNVVFDAAIHNNINNTCNNRRRYSHEYSYLEIINTEMRIPVKYNVVYRYYDIFRVGTCTECFTVISRWKHQRGY